MLFGRTERRFTLSYDSFISRVRCFRDNEKGCRRGFRSVLPNPEVRKFLAERGKQFWGRKISSVVITNSLLLRSAGLLLFWVETQPLRCDPDASFEFGPKLLGVLWRLPKQVHSAEQ